MHAVRKTTTVKIIQDSFKHIVAFNLENLSMTNVKYVLYMFCANCDFMYATRYWWIDIYFIRYWSKASFSGEIWEVFQLENGDKKGKESISKCTGVNALVSMQMKYFIREISHVRIKLLIRPSYLRNVAHISLNTRWETTLKGGYR